MISQKAISRLCIYFTDRSGQITIDENPTDASTGNGQLHNGLFICAIAENGEEVGPLWRDWFVSAINRTVARSVDGVPLFGLFWRSMWKVGDNASWEDRVLIACAAYHTKTQYAADIVRRGIATGYQFDGSRPVPPIYEIENSDERFLWVVPFYEMCARVRVNLIGKLSICVSLLLMAFSNQADSFTKGYGVQSVLKRESRLLGGLTAMMWWVVVRVRFGTIGKAWMPYFKEGHPLNEVT